MQIIIASFVKIKKALHIVLLFLTLHKQVGYGMPVHQRFLKIRAESQLPVEAKLKCRTVSVAITTLL